MIIRKKELELMKYIYITHLSTFDSKVFLTLKIMEFENITFLGGEGGGKHLA